MSDHGSYCYEAITEIADEVSNEIEPDTVSDEFLKYGVLGIWEIVRLLTRIANSLDHEDRKAKATEAA